MGLQWGALVVVIRFLINESLLLLFICPPDCDSHPLATGPDPHTDYPLDNPFDLTQRS